MESKIFWEEKCNIQLKKRLKGNQLIYTECYSFDNPMQSTDKISSGFNLFFEILFAQRQGAVIIKVVDKGKCEWSKQNFNV